MPCQGLVFGETLVPVSRVHCFLVSVTVAVIQISFSYSILSSKLTSLMLHDTLFLVLSGFWLDVSIFQHMHPWLWGGKVVIEVEIQEGLNGRCSCPLAEELHVFNCTKTGHMPFTPGKSVHVARTSENLRPCIHVIWLPKWPFSCLGNVFLVSLRADKSLERWILKDLVPEVK